MSVSTSDLVGLMFVCVPILVLILYSVRFSKKKPGSSEAPQIEKSAQVRVVKGRR